jgi:hypothetical protein
MEAVWWCSAVKLIDDFRSIQFYDDILCTESHGKIYIKVVWNFITGWIPFLAPQLLFLSNFNAQLQNHLTLAPQLPKLFNFDPRAIWKPLKTISGLKLNGFDSWGAKVRQKQRVEGQNGLNQVLGFLRYMKFFIHFDLLIDGSVWPWKLNIKFLGACIPPRCVS